MLDTGLERWSVTIPTRFMSSPIIVNLHSATIPVNHQCNSNRGVVLGGYDGFLYIWCVDNGQLLLQRNLEGKQITNEVAIDGNDIYVSTNGGQLIKLSTSK